MLPLTLSLGDVLLYLQDRLCIRVEQRIVVFANMRTWYHVGVNIKG